MSAECPVNASKDAGQRREKRARVLLAAKIRTAFGEEDVRLRDLSRKGALIECANPPARDSEVVFSRGSTVVQARVAWTAGTRCGLEFLTMIDEAEVMAHAGRPPAPKADVPMFRPPPPPLPADRRFKRPRIGESTMSDHERKLAEVWGVAVGISVSDD